MTETVETYDVGKQAVMRATFEHEGKKVDPTTVTCTTKDVDGNIATHTVTKVETGVFEAKATIEKGPTNSDTAKFYYAFDGTGAYVGSGEKYFNVRRQRVPR